MSGRAPSAITSSFSGLAEVEKLPGAMFVIDTKREQIAVREAIRLNIPIVAICDTNADPDTITHPIPGNDDAIRSVRLLTSLITDSIAAGRRRFEVEQKPIEPIPKGAPGESDNVAAAGVSNPDSPSSSNVQKG